MGCGQWLVYSFEFQAISKRWPSGSVKYPE
jgi:hypothetical protein